MRIGNWPLVMLVLEHVIKHPAEYSQSTWGKRTGCGTTRCIAGWLAHFAGYRDHTEQFPSDLIFAVEDAKGNEVSIERAALRSMELDPEVYGRIPLTRDGEDDDLWEEAEALASTLFSGSMPFSLILDTFYDLAQRDGVTLTPVITDALRAEGVIA